jgi:hypothetical protein
VFEAKTVLDGMQGQINNLSATPGPPQQVQQPDPWTEALQQQPMTRTSQLVPGQTPSSAQNQMHMTGSVPSGLEHWSPAAPTSAFGVQSGTGGCGTTGSGMVPSFQPGTRPSVSGWGNAGNGMGTMGSYGV